MSINRFSHRPMRVYHVRRRVVKTTKFRMPWFSSRACILLKLRAGACVHLACNSFCLLGVVSWAWQKVKSRFSSCRKVLALYVQWYSEYEGKEGWGLLYMILGKRSPCNIHRGGLFRVQPFHTVLLLVLIPWLQGPWPSRPTTPTGAGLSPTCSPAGGSSRRSEATMWVTIRPSHPCEPHRATSSPRATSGKSTIMSQGTGNHGIPSGMTVTSQARGLGGVPALTE